VRRSGERRPVSSRMFCTSALAWITWQVQSTPDLIVSSKLIKQIYYYIAQRSLALTPNSSNDFLSEFPL